MTGNLRPRLRSALRFQEIYQPPAIPEHTGVLPESALAVLREFLDAHCAA
jgi:hypothetical protein